VREIVRLDYVAKALASGKSRFQVSAREVLHKAEEDPNFPRARTPLICNVLQSKKLLEENGLEIEQIEGPPKRQSRRVVVHYAFRKDNAGARIRTEAESVPGVAVEPEESPEERAFRLTEKIRGLMKDEIAAHGGAEGYFRWVRGEDEEAA
jgi:hypothetical protein